MYLQILNVLLILILIGLLIWLGWNVYQSSQPITKYEASEFPEGFGIERKIEFPESLDSKIEIKMNFTQNGGIVILRITSLKHFKIDWGNGLEVPYTGSDMAQKLPPIGYGKGDFTIKIVSEPNSIVLLDMQNTNQNETLESITFTNTVLPKELLPKWNISTVKIIQN
jgi:hypothetical protein